MRKESVILNGVKYPLVYLTPASYKELYAKVIKHATNVTMKSKGFDEANPYKNVVIELKGFVFNHFIFTEEV